MDARTSAATFGRTAGGRLSRRVGALALIAGLVFAGLLAPTVSVAQSDDATAANEEVARRFFDELHTEGDLDVAEEIATADTVFHTPDGDLQGPEGIAGLVSVLRTAFPDATFPIEDLIAADDKVVVRWSMQGTHEGAFQDIAPTGNAVEWGGTAILQIADGKIVEHWVVYDRLSLLQQLDALPGGSPEAKTHVTCGTCAVTA